MPCEQLWPLILSAEHFADIFQPFCHLPTQPSATSPKIKAVLILSQLTLIFPAESNLVTKIVAQVDGDVPSVSELKLKGVWPLLRWPWLDSDAELSAHSWQLHV